MGTDRNERGKFLNLRLCDIGTEFVSRAEARRLLDGMDSFEEITLDFRDRYFAAPINMNDAVEFMVERGLPHN